MTEAVDRVLAALNDRDLEAFVACYTADATIEDGHDRLAGDFVVEEETVTGRGEPQRYVAVYLIRDGLIARERLIA